MRKKEFDGPAIALLGGLPYSVLVTAAGSGVSRYGQLFVNRWRNDATRDAHGQWCYLMNVATGKVWSAGHQPVAAPAAEYRADLSAERVTIERRDEEIGTKTEIVVFADRTGEARRVTLTNLASAEAIIELTSYQEIVLATPVSDRGHRAFGNLFVQTEWLPESSAVLAMRRPRSARDTPIWCGHAVAVGNGETVTCETDRARFIGRGRTCRNPAAMDDAGELTGQAGAVLDPVLALRTRVRIAPKQSASTIFTTFTARDRDDGVARSKFLSRVENAEAAMVAGTALPKPPDKDEERYRRLAAELIFGSGVPSVGNRDDLLALGISGDLPIVLADVSGQQGIDASRAIITMIDHFKAKGVAANAVFLCIDEQTAHGMRRLIEPSLGNPDLIVHTRPFLSPGEIGLLQSVARLHIDCANNGLSS